jgi:AcrR family transcriptional regulator
MAAPDTSDPRIVRSRAQLVDALGTLLRSRDARDVSVSALCAEAGVSRPTFYQHFAGVDDVAVAGVERRFAGLRAGLADGPDAPYRLLVAFLTELDRERDTWRHTIGSGNASAASRDAVEGWFAERLAERAPDAGPVAVRYAAGGFLAAVRAWLRDESTSERPDAEALAAQLVELASRVLGTRSSVTP